MSTQDSKARKRNLKSIGEPFSPTATTIGMSDNVVLGVSPYAYLITIMNSTAQVLFLSVLL